MRERWIELRRHPSKHPQAVRAVHALVRRTPGGELHLSFRLEGDISRIQIPQRHAPGIAAELWRHTCFEAFVAVEGQPAYHEFNFAPSGEWAVYAFRGYRDASPRACEMPRPSIAVRSAGDRLELDTSIRLEALSPLHPGAPLRIGLSAVIEAGDGLSYWALRHPDGKPDFHHAAGFALRVEPPRRGC